MEELYVVPEYVLSESDLKYHNKLKKEDYPAYGKINVNKQGERLGLKTFDVALPQKWVDSVIAETGINPCGVVVWCYDNSKCFGEGVGITGEGIILMAIYNHIREKQR